MISVVWSSWLRFPRTAKHALPLRQKESVARRGHGNSRESLGATSATRRGGTGQRSMAGATRLEAQRLHQSPRPRPTKLLEATQSVLCSPRPCLVPLPLPARLLWVPGSPPCPPTWRLSSTVRATSIGSGSVGGVRRHRHRLSHRVSRVCPLRRRVRRHRHHRRHRRHRHRHRAEGAIGCTVTVQKATRSQSHGRMSHGLGLVKAKWAKRPKPLVWSVHVAQDNA